ncbi:hypothetical protein KUTeg_001721 [Tegillarca granosa]|uniref:Integrase catalytic domain-containing protein n=1 Tax=Tegillarca granosa TaxID=220873 RepID=A0ABQ9FS94_TEGGR|nr:hypothetical protein KUTeg_001721 [Tegillarca granosa]
MVLVPYDRYQRLTSFKPDQEVKYLDAQQNVKKLKIQSENIIPKTEPEVKILETLSIEDILVAIPNNVRNKARALLNHLRKHLKWNDRGEISADGHIIPGSNIVDLVKASVKEYKDFKPVGLELFNKVIHDSNTPLSLLATSNKQIGSGLQPPPGAPTSVSKYVWTVPLHSTKGKEMVSAFVKIFTKKRKPTRIRSDKGSEFNNKYLKRYLKEQNVDYFVTQNVVKASYAERAFKTIKSRIQHYLTKKQTHRWMNVLDKITESYNHTYHRTIKRTPASVKPKDSVSLWKTIYKTKAKVQPKVKSESKGRSYRRIYKFKVGDVVRISFLKKPFQKEYDERWSRELFVVTERFVREDIPQYKLKDYANDIIDGVFYQNQLNKAYEQEVYFIEKVLKTRGKAVNKAYLVRWKGW